MRNLSSPPAMRQQIELLEALEYAGLLTESKRMDFFKANYGAKLVARYNEERERGLIPVIAAAIEHEKGEGDDADSVLASKIISFIVSHDPSRNHAYSQWMIMRWLKGNIRLEDLTSINDNLITFDSVKARLASKDINTYKTAAELHDAIEPYLKLEAPISGKAEDRRLDQRMHQEDHVEILYNNKDYKILIPLTFDASNHFGRGTRWCTTSNTGNDGMFKHYCAMGPLFIIIEKATGRRWQFHFESQQFMNERDEQISLKEFAKSHPRVIEIFGDKRFINHVKDLGLTFFKPSTIAAMSGDQVASGIASRSDLEHLTPNQINDPAVLVYADTNSLRTFQPHHDPNSSIVAWFLDAGMSEESLRAAVSIKGNLIAQLPAFMLDDDIKIAAINAKNPAYAQAVPKPWPPEVDEIFWIQRAETHRILLADVPEESRTRDVIMTVFARKPSEIEKHRDLLTPDMIEPLSDMNSNACLYFAPEDQTMGMVDALAKSSAIDNDEMKLVAKIDSSLWTPTFVNRFIGLTITKKSQIPDHLWNAVTIDKFLGNNKTELTGITESDLELVASFGLPRVNMAKLFLNNPKRMHQINPALVDQDDIDRVVNSTPSLFPEVPQQFRTNEIVAMALRDNQIPVEEMPESVRTITNVARRLISLFTPSRPPLRGMPTPIETPIDPGKEFRDAMAIFEKDDLIGELVRIHPDMLEKVPEEYLTEKALFGLLSAEVREYGYHNRQLDQQNREKLERRFKRFPPATWSTRNVKLILKKNLEKREVGNIPPKSIDTAIAETICVSTPAQWKKLPKRLRTPELLTKVSEHSPSVLLHAEAALVTEEIAYSAMVAYAKRRDASASSYSYDGEKIFTKLPIPVEDWTQRMWDTMVGLFDGVMLTDVPMAMRHHGLIATAISRDTDNIKALKDPALWLTQNSKLLKDKIKLVSFMKKLEKSGVVKVAGGGFRNVDDMEREKLKSGWEVGIALAKGERRFYLYNEKGDKVLTFYTQEGKLRFTEYPRDEHREHLLEIVRKHLTDHELKELNNLHIYGNKQMGVRTEKELDRQPIEGTDLFLSLTPHGSEHSAVIWSGDTAVLRLRCEAWASYRRDSYSISKAHHIEILDNALAWTKVDEIFKFWKTIREVYATPYSIGIISCRGEIYNLRNRSPIGKVEGLDLYFNGDQAGLFDDKAKKMVSWAMVKKTGEMSATYTSWKWDYEKTQKANNLQYRLNVEPLVKAHIAAAKPKVAAKPRR